MKNKINDLKDVIRQFSLISQELLAENQFLQKQIQQKENEISELKIRSEKEVSKLERQTEILETDKKALKEQKEKLTSDISKKKKEIVEENEKYKKKIDGLTEKLEDCKKQLRENGVYKRDYEFMKDQLDESNRRIEEMLEEILRKLDSDSDFQIGSDIEKQGCCEILDELKVMLKGLKYEYGEDDDEKIFDKKDVAGDNAVNDSGESSKENNNDTSENTQEIGMKPVDVDM